MIFDRLIHQGEPNTMITLDVMVELKVDEIVRLLLNWYQ